MKISVITVTYNSGATINDTLESVSRQTYPDIEHIIVDGGSVDNTLNEVKQFPHIEKIISEPDKGIYDALNKGIKLASGDIIGILHSDDLFKTNLITSQIAAAFEGDKTLQAVYGDVAFIRGNNKGKILRYYSSAKFNNSKFEYGYMPAHPSFFCRKECFKQFGFYRTDMKIGADFELLLRFMAVHKINTKYLPVCTTLMRVGGESTSGIKSVFTINKDFRKALKENGFSSSYFKLYGRYVFKWKEFVGNKKFDSE